MLVTVVIYMTGNDVSNKYILLCQAMFTRKTVPSQCLFYHTDNLTNLSKSFIFFI